MGVILRRSRQRPAAEQLRALILSEEGQAILRQFGFLPADESP
jgi:ABC-type molybdate transport system substrate-binding protein